MSKTKTATQPTCPGHFHLELASGKIVNGTAKQVKTALNKDDYSRVVECGWVCTYGCGLLHPLCDADLKFFGLTKDYQRKSSK